MLGLVLCCGCTPWDRSPRAAAATQWHDASPCPLLHPAAAQGRGYVHARLRMHVSTACMLQEGADLDAELDRLMEVASRCAVCCGWCACHAGRAWLPRMPRVCVHGWGIACMQVRLGMSDAACCLSTPHVPASWACGWLVATALVALLPPARLQPAHQAHSRAGGG